MKNNIHIHTYRQAGRQTDRQTDILLHLAPGKLLHIRNYYLVIIDKKYYFHLVSVNNSMQRQH